MEPVVWNYTGEVDDAGALVQGAMWHRGATKRDLFTFALSGANEGNGFTPRRDLTGCEARMEVRTKKKGGTLILTISEEVSEDGQITINGPDGEVTYFVSKVGIAKLIGSTAWYDLFIEWPNGIDVDKGVMGQIAIDWNVTDPTYD